MSKDYESTMPLVMEMTKVAEEVWGHLSDEEIFEGLAATVHSSTMDLGQAANIVAGLQLALMRERRK